MRQPDDYTEQEAALFELQNEIEELKKARAKDFEEIKREVLAATSIIMMPHLEGVFAVVRERLGILEGDTEEGDT
ncbi:coil containing protein [Vibrio phage 1.215.B._10N.222.54.F7]|nr:coil containing protein [Vibrio phage 1.215.A._10N.222.54.F7]AUR96057.1 coil containing protein [Vibrio phage 1.215.B._10N.222.54.F7]